MSRGRSSITPTDEEILALDNVLPEVAGRYIKMSSTTICRGLQQGRIPFGFAVENTETQTWTYNISPGGLVKYKQEGQPIIRLGDMREMLTDCIKDYTDAKMNGLNRVLRSVMEA